MGGEASGGGEKERVGMDPGVDVDTDLDVDVDLRDFGEAGGMEDVEAMEGGGRGAEKGAEGATGPEDKWWEAQGESEGGEEEAGEEGGETAGEGEEKDEDDLDVVVRAEVEEMLGKGPRVPRPGTR